MGVVSIPIKVYKAVSEYGISGSLYHEDCGNKIKQFYECEEHPGEVIEVFSGVDIGGQIVSLDSTTKGELLGRKAPLKVVSSHKLSELSKLMVSNDLVPIGMHEVASALPAKSPLPDDAFATLLNRLRVKRRFLLLSLGISGCERYAALLPNGQLHALAYSEEVREFNEVRGSVNRELAGYMDDKLDELSGDFPVLSLEKISKSVENWFGSQIEIILKPRKGKKKSQSPKVDVMA